MGRLAWAVLLLLVGAAAEDCVVDEVDIARIHATDDDAAADVVAAVLALSLIHI